MWRATCVVGVVCAVLAALALLAGCEEAEVVYVWPDAEVDGGTPDLGDLGDVDADAGHDAGRRDAGARDAGQDLSPLDAGRTCPAARFGNVPTRVDVLGCTEVGAWYLRPSESWTSAGGTVHALQAANALSADLRDELLGPSIEQSAVVRLFACGSESVLTLSYADAVFGESVLVQVRMVDLADPSLMHTSPARIEVDDMPAFGGEVEVVYASGGEVHWLAVRASWSAPHPSRFDVAAEQLDESADGSACDTSSIAFGVQLCRVSWGCNQAP